MKAAAAQGFAAALLTASAAARTVVGRLVLLLTGFIVRTNVQAEV